MDFVEICNIYVRKMIIKAAQRIFISDKMCRSYSDLNFGVTFWEHSVDIRSLANTTIRYVCVSCQVVYNCGTISMKISLTELL